LREYYRQAVIYKRKTLNRESALAFGDGFSNAGRIFDEILKVRDPEIAEVYNQVLDWYLQV
jgi:hypothetical protein